MVDGELWQVLDTCFFSCLTSSPCLTDTVSLCPAKTPPSPSFSSRLASSYCGSLSWDLGWSRRPIAHVYTRKGLYSQGSDCFTTRWFTLGNSQLPFCTPVWASDLGGLPWFSSFAGIKEESGMFPELFEPRFMLAGGLGESGFPRSLPAE